MENEIISAVDFQEWRPLKEIHDRVSSYVASGVKVWNRGCLIPGVLDLPPLERLAMPRERGGEELITESHKEAGRKFRTICLCSAHLPAPIGEEESSKINNTSAVIKKVAITRQLQYDHREILLMIVEERVVESDYPKLRAISSMLYSAFDSLERAMSKEGMKRTLDNLRERARMHPISSSHKYA